MAGAKWDAGRLMRTERDIFRSPVVTVGRVRCAAGHPEFALPGRVVGYRFVFPRTSVWIQAARARRFVSDPSVVEFYNHGDEFVRTAIDPAGDHTDWYQLNEADLRELVRRHDPEAADRQRPFRVLYGPTDYQAYVRQRHLVHRIAAGTVTGPLEVEETVLDVLDRVIAGVVGVDRRADHVITRDERDIAERAAVVLSGMTSAHVSLRGIARAAGVSVFHLSRVFRKVTGRTLARHHLHLRLQASLASLDVPGATIGEVAMRHGFARHSHYTRVFRRAFGVTPLSYRARRRLNTRVPYFSSS